jgi:hypothetical protein
MAAARVTAAQCFPFDLFTYGDFPSPAGDMIRKLRRLSMVPPCPWGQWLYGRVLAEQCARLPGDVVEAGVARGGMSIYLGLLIRQLGLEKTVFAVDSFEGLPLPDERLDNAYFSEGEYAFAAGADAGLAAFWAAAASYGLSGSLVPVSGWFADVLPGLAARDGFCFVHVDADLYHSVLDALEHLYDRLVPGGVLAIDDFFHPSQGACRAASDFFNARRLSPVYHVVFPYSVFVVADSSHRLARHRRSLDGNAYSLEWLKRDEVFLAALERSLGTAQGSARARASCRLLLRVLTRRRSHPSDIYDYWRALADFWDWIDVLPDERKPHRI